jgi:hypothetical protein
MSQLNEKTFPTLFTIAMNYLPIQASSVPSERVFSSSAETDTKKHNRIHPILMEALQMLKFALKKERLDFMQGWSTTENTMREREPDEGIDLLSQLLREEDTEDVIDQIICDLDDEEELVL